MQQTMSMTFVIIDRTRLYINIKPLNADMVLQQHDDNAKRSRHEG